MNEIRKIKTIASGAQGRLEHIKWRGTDKAYKIFLDGVETSLTEIDVLFRISNPSLIRGWELRHHIEGTLKTVGIVEDLRTGSLNSDFFDFTTPDLTKPIVEKFIEQICSALYCLAQAGYYHTDLKPDNLLFQQHSSNIKSAKDVDFYLGDYGYLTPLTYRYEQEKDIYENPSHLGLTRNYAPPEYLEHKVYATSSIWSLGLSLLEMICGDKDRPFVQDKSKLGMRTYYSKLYLWIDRKLKIVKRMGLSQIAPMLNRNPLTRPFPEDFLAQVTPCQYRETLEIDQNFPMRLRRIYYEYCQYVSRHQRKLKLTDREFYLAFTYIMRLVSYGEISHKLFEPALVLASWFYRGHYRVGKTLDINFIKKLKGYIFTNEVYVNASSLKQIQKVMKVLDTNPRRFTEYIKIHFDYVFKPLEPK